MRQDGLGTVLTSRLDVLTHIFLLLSSTKRRGFLPFQVAVSTWVLVF